MIFIERKQSPVSETKPCVLFVGLGHNADEILAVEICNKDSWRIVFSELLRKKFCIIGDGPFMSLIQI